MLFKFDLNNKAYDKLEWNFLNKALECWSFEAEFKDLILGCVSTV